MPKYVQYMTLTLSQCPNYDSEIHFCARHEAAGSNAVIVMGINKKKKVILSQVLTSLYLVFFMDKRVATHKRLKYVDVLCFIFYHLKCKYTSFPKKDFITQPPVISHVTCTLDNKTPPGCDPKGVFCKTPPRNGRSFWEDV